MSDDRTRHLRCYIASCIGGASLLRIGAEATSIVLGLYLSYLNSHVRPIGAMTVGVIGTGYYIVQLAGAPVMGAWSDIIGRKPLMCLGPLISVVAVLVYPATTSVALIFALLTLEGLSAAMRAPAALSYLSEATSVSERLRGRTMGVYQVTLLGSMVAGYVLGGSLWEVLGPGGFRVITLIYLLGSTVILLGVKEQARLTTNRMQDLRRYLRAATDQAVVWFLPTWLTLNTVLGAWLSQTTYQLSTQRGTAGQALLGQFSGVQIGLILGTLAILFAGGTVVWGLLIGRVSKTTIMIASALGMYLACGALLVLNHGSVGMGASFEATSLLAVIALVLGVFLVSGFTPAAFAYLADLSDRALAERGAIVGGYYVFLSIGQLLGVWLGGIAGHMARLDGLVILTLGLVTIGFATLALARRKGIGSGVV